MQSSSCSAASPSEAFAGIRVLPSNSNQSPSELSRDYCFEVHPQPAPLVNILSGKLTTYRCLATKVIDSLKPVFSNLNPSSTHIAPLPGSTWQHGSFEEYLDYASSRYAWLEPSILQHYLHNYGSRMEQLLENCAHSQDLGLAFGPILHQKEVDFLCQTEWAQSADDILLRRTQLGLSMTKEDQQALENYLTQHP